MVNKMQLFQMCDEPHTMDMLDEETEMKQVLKRESLLHSSRKFVLSGAEKVKSCPQRSSQGGRSFAQVFFATKHKG